MPAASYDACVDATLAQLGAPDGALLPILHAIQSAYGYVPADSGRPTVVADPDGQVAQIYKRIARKVAVKVAEKAKDMTSKFPSIVIKND